MKKTLQVGLILTALAFACSPRSAAAQTFGGAYDTPMSAAIAGGVFGSSEVEVVLVEKPGRPGPHFAVRAPGAAGERLVAKAEKGSRAPSDLAVRLGDRHFDASQCRVAPASIPTSTRPGAPLRAAGAATTELDVVCRSVQEKAAPGRLTRRQQAALARFRGVRTRGGLSLTDVPHQRKGEWADCLDNPANEGSTAQEVLHGCFCLLLGNDGDTGC
jgi:hypothetical protein